MNKSALRWCIHIGMDAFIAVAFWRGCLLGEAGWLNLFSFVVWFLAIAGIVAGSLCFLGLVRGIARRDDSRSALFWYGTATDIVLLAALVWIGWLWTAGFLSAAYVLLHSFRCKFIRRGEKEGGGEKP